MLTDGTTELDVILEKALKQPDYRAGLILLMQKEHDRVNRINKDKESDRNVSLPVSPMFSYLLDNFDEQWQRLHRTSESADILNERIKGSTGTLALMSMLTPETTLGQFREAILRLAKDLTDK